MNQLQTSQNNSITFSSEQIAVVKNQIAKDATDMELKSFIYQCERTGLDPFSRQIYFMKDKSGKVMIQTSIDGFRLIAERSGAYEGQTQALWCGPDGVWKDVWMSPDYPVAAKVGVYKKGFREALYAIAHWNEYFGVPGFMHKKMPTLMLAKVAESLALRKAFPNEMSGLYTQEEMNNEPEKTKTIVSETKVAPRATPIVLPKDAKLSSDGGFISRRENPPFIMAQETPIDNAEMVGAFEQFNAPQGDVSSGPIDENALGVELYVCKFGKKHINKTLQQIGTDDVKSYGDYIAREAHKGGKEMRGDVLEFYNKGKIFLNSRGLDYDFK